MNKSSIIPGIFLLALVIPLTTAYTDISYGLERGIDQVTEIATPIFEALLGTSNAVGEFSASEILFAKILFLFLLIIILHAVLKKIPTLGENKGVVKILAILIPIISLRHISDSQTFYGLLLPYNTLGIAITTLLPFVLFFFVIEKSSMGVGGRKLSWGLFTLIFIILWVSRFNNISPIGNWIYGCMIGLAVLALLFDRTIQGYFRTHELSSFFSSSRDQRIANLQLEWEKYKDLTTAAGKSIQKRILKEFRDLQASSHFD